MNKDAAQRRADCGLKIEGRKYNTRLEMVGMLSLDERRVRGVLGVEAGIDHCDCLPCLVCFREGADLFQNETKGFVSRTIKISSMRVSSCPNSRRWWWGT